ncbi:MAG: DUF790 family protein [Gammaproteobacteria bacterium]|nr:DUF790 family protein [Gammaproteobacteria bacterium]MCP5459609.1 DUF790 family protein [Gammaproteobacteria bacterium]
MLPSELLLSSRRGPQVYPHFLKSRQRVWADEVLALIAAHQQKTRGELQQALRGLEGDSPDYRIVRGFAHLALGAAEFRLALPDIDPGQLRREVFTLASEAGYGERQARTVLEVLGERYGLQAEVLRDALYADLPERHVLSVLPDYTPETLVDRYNLAQAQGLLYSALSMRIIAHRNVPGEYRRLFQRLKFHGLLYAVEGHLEDGYQIHVDGPASLFRQTRRYGIKMATFLPALLHISRWEMQAALLSGGREVQYQLGSEDSRLRSHHPRPPAYDSLLERSFAERWEKLDTPWALEREVEIVDLKGTVFVPDFALRHPDGRVVHVEIMGFWHPDYLRRKLDKVRRADMGNLILAVSDRLNVGEEDIKNIPGPVVFFKGKLEPRKVLELLETRP